MAEVTARKRIWGWMMLDWATQPFYTLLLTFIFGPYFAEIASGYYIGTGADAETAKALAQSYWTLGLTITGLFIAFSAPVLGALADTTGRHMPWMVLFSLFYVAGTFSLWWMVPDGSAMLFCLIAFGAAMIGAEFMLVFVNALLPSLGRRDEIGDLSGSGFALGYAGGVVALFIILLFFAESQAGVTFIGIEPIMGLDGAAREGTRSVGPFTALWFIIFIVPFFLWVRDPREPKKGNGVGAALSDLGRSVMALRQKPSLATYLGSSMLYRDALNAIYGVGGFYAALVLEWDITKIGIFGIIAAISAAGFSWAGGKADKRFGPKPVIVVNVWILIIVVTVIVNMTRDSFFGMALADGSTLPDIVMFVLGAVIGGSGGALQGASRTMMARHTDSKRPTEAFGLYAFSGKATAFLAPGLLTFVTHMTNSPRYGLVPLIGLFIVALILLRWVNPDGNRGEP